MPAKCKSDLIAITDKEFAKLIRLIGDLPEVAASIKDADDTSIKDVIAHRAHWIDLFLGWYADGQAGREVAFPAPGYRWNDLKRYNADLRTRQAGLGWPTVVALLRDRAAALRAFLEGLSDAELYGGPMKGAKNAWTTGRWAEAAGPSRYRSAAKYARGRLKERAWC